MNLAVRESKTTSGHGFADYLLFVNGKAVGALTTAAGIWLTAAIGVAAGMARKRRPS
jgi:hypothetical protein